MYCILEPLNLPDETKLTSLFIRVQDIIRSRLSPIYITHIWSHMGLQSLLEEGNTEIDWLLIESVLKDSEFHKKHHVNSKGLKVSITWGQAKEIIKWCPNTLSISDYHYLQGRAKRKLKGRISGRWMCSYLRNLEN